MMMSQPGEFWLADIPFTNSRHFANVKEPLAAHSERDRILP
jgi:hypothetical protein